MHIQKHHQLKIPRHPPLNLHTQFIKSLHHTNNGYLNSPTSPPPRVPPPPPIQESRSMDITLTLSPITPIDVQFNTSTLCLYIVNHPSLVDGGDHSRLEEEEDALLVDDIEGGLCVDYTDAGIGGRCYSGSNQDKGKELWDSLESKYMAENSCSKKFLVSSFNNYKMVDSRPVMEQFNELLRILGQYTQHGLKMDESISVSSIIDKFPPSWKDFKHILKHSKDDSPLVQLGSHLCIEEHLRAQKSDKGKSKEIGGPSINMTKEVKNKHHKQNKGKKWSNKNNSGSSSNKKLKLECWKCDKTGHFKRDCCSGKKNNANAGGLRKGSKDQSQNQGQNLVPVWNIFIKYSISLISEAFYVQVDAIAWWIDFGATTHVCKYCCWFKTYEPVEDRSVLYMGDEHFAPVHGKGSVALEFSSGKTITLFNVLYVPKLRKNLVSVPMLNKFYVIEPNDSVSINLIIKSRDVIFDENHFSSIPRPNDIIPNVQESQMDDHTDDVPNEIPEPRRGKRAKKAKSYGSDFQLYLVEGSRDQVGSQYSYCYSIEEDPRTYNEA
ncbi:zinc finger, CCHC-type containing protein, partial [Tanacetum coccineum]